MEGEYIPKEITEKKEEKPNRLSGVLRQSLFSDLLTLIAGLFLFFKSGIFHEMVGYVVGVIVILIGALNIYICVKKNNVKLSSMPFLFSIFLIAIGIFILCSPLVVVRTITLMAGLLMCIMGINKIVYSALLKMASFKIWLFSLIIGILVFLFGVLIMIDPFTEAIITKIVGVILMAVALSDLINLLIIKKESKNIIELHW